MYLHERLANELQKRKESKNYRQLSVKSGLLDFTSNDYLGLAHNQELKDNIHNTDKELLNGSGGSRLLSGNTLQIEQTEAYLAQLFECESTLVFQSGYMANLALFSTLPQRGDTVLYDELSHACIKDGIRLSLATKYSFRHNDLDDLSQKLKKSSGQVFIAVESVYSMDGDHCSLKDLVALAGNYDAKIILDEAHATGLMGKHGGGLSMLLEQHTNILARVYTFGKAMGVHGAAIAGSSLLKEYLVNYARPFIYTTAPSPHAVSAIDESFRYLNRNIHLQTQISKKIQLFKELFKQKCDDKFTSTSSQHAIQALIVPGNENAIKTSIHLANKGFDVRPILSPTVKKGSERIRICLHTYNSSEDISRLIDSLADL
ncbi:8-amino-7-oxononanoate synthase [Fulvivirga sp. M361]|uniref:aminotransferase class I/II-fold pyridoxal phosphate-dependent enzyme n=1 Tax=Fulvivirga sp. M361 TaxID=2594266 RepID=UPI00117AF4FF|nr:8-amino-7-oxononanoate synthase [Fulvivirga sp. M361]TRX58302.1 8-amino-7-oxononanoate synthase [Fulvivirga sp. M361]